MPSDTGPLSVPARSLSNPAGAQRPRQTENQSRYSEATLKKAKRWVAKKGQVGGSNTAYYLRDFHDADFSGAAFIPTIKDSIGGFIIGGIATVLGNIRRRIQESNGIAVPRQVKMELSSAPDHWARPPKGTLADVKDNLKYTAAMEYAYRPYREKGLLSSADLQSGVRNQNQQPRNVENEGPESDGKDEVVERQGADLYPKAYKAAAQTLESHQHWDFVPIHRDRMGDARIQNDQKVQRFFRNLPSEVKDNLNENGTYTHPLTGNVISLLYDTKSNEIVISHGGTGAADVSKNDDKFRNAQHLSNLGNWFSMFKVPGSVKQAIAFSTLVRDAAARAGIVDEEGNPNVVDVGHSRGGLMAQAAALANEGRAVCSNAEPMGPAVQRAVGLKYNTKKAASTKILHLSHENDIVSTQTGLRRLGQVFRFITGLPTQASAGKFITLPGLAGELDSKGNPSGLGFFGTIRDSHSVPFRQMVEAIHQFERERTIMEKYKVYEILQEAEKHKQSIVKKNNFSGKYPKFIENIAKILNFYWTNDPEFKEGAENLDIFKNNKENLDVFKKIKADIYHLRAFIGKIIDNYDFELGEKNKDDAASEKAMFYLFNYLSAYLIKDIENIKNKPTLDLMRACESGNVLSPFMRPPEIDVQSDSMPEEWMDDMAKDQQKEDIWRIAEAFSSGPLNLDAADSEQPAEIENKQGAGIKEEEVP